MFWGAQARSIERAGRTGWVGAGPEGDWTPAMDLAVQARAGFVPVDDASGGLTLVSVGSTPQPGVRSVLKAEPGLLLSGLKYSPHPTEEFVSNLEKTSWKAIEVEKLNNLLSRQMISGDNATVSQLLF